MLSTEEKTPAPGSGNFNAIHAAPGAFMSFTCGHWGTPQGLALERGSPANQVVLVGVRSAPGHGPGDRPRPRYLPFFRNAPQVDAEAAYDVDRQGGTSASQPLDVFTADTFKRYYDYASDEWRTSSENGLPPMSFEVFTPFHGIPDPDNSDSTLGKLREALAPVVVARLEVDNTSGSETCSGIFGLGFGDEEKAVADLMDAGLPSGAVGFAVAGRLGFAGMLEEGGALYPVQAFGTQKMHQAGIGIERLGNSTSMVFDVPRGQKRTLRLVFGVFLDGIVTTRLRCSYLYTEYFSSLPDVLHYGLGDYENRVRRALSQNVDIKAKGLSGSQYFLASHAVRSYFGSSEMLNLGGSPYYVVNEGGYVMMNTLDLSVDHMFFECSWSPWVVRNILDNFLDYYSYVDEVVDPTSGAKSPGGLTFTHDQGFQNQFSPRGYSSYERAGYTGCFSYMTQEQLCNWVLLAGTYMAHEKDEAWGRRRLFALLACLESMENRDHPDPQRRNGVMGLDSSRCEGGQEITTYDSLDPSLKQARANLYLSVKCWAAYLSLAMCLDTLGRSAEAARAVSCAHRVADSVCGMVQATGWIPAVFEESSPGFESRILPAAEGLVYPLFWAGHGYERAGAWLDWKGGEFAGLLGALRGHVGVLVKDGGNVFGDGGVKLSSTSEGSWMSKIAVFQHVARKWMGLEFAGADEAHVGWQLDPSAAPNAMCDQISAGKAVGSLYYPRCVTNHLWW